MNFDLKKKDIELLPDQLLEQLLGLATIVKRPPKAALELTLCTATIIEKCDEVIVDPAPLNDILMRSLATCNIVGETKCEPAFFPCNQTITEIGHKGPLYYRDELICEFFFPRIGGEMLSSRIVNNLNLMTQHGLCGVPSNDHILLGVKEKIEGKMALLFGFRTSDDKRFRIYWDDAMIKVDTVPLDVPLYLIKKNNLLYNYSNKFLYDDVNGFEVRNTVFEYFSFAHFDRGCNLFIDIDGITYDVPVEKTVRLVCKDSVFFDSTMKRIEVVTNSVYDDGVYAVVLVGNLFFVRERLVGSKAFSPQQIQFVLQNQVSAEELFMRLLVSERDVVAVRPLSVKIVPNSMKALTVNLGNSDVAYSCEYQRTCTRSAFFAKFVGEGQYDYERTNIPAHELMYEGCRCGPYVRFFPINEFRFFSFSHQWFPGASRYVTDVRSNNDFLYCYFKIDPLKNFYHLQFADFHNLSDEMFNEVEKVLLVDYNLYCVAADNDLKTLLEICSPKPIFLKILN